MVPTHWCLEVVNVLALAEKKNRISRADADEFARLLAVFQIVIDDQAPSRAFDHILNLSRVHALTSYDAAYLDLAMRTQLPLATLDDDLRNAATSVGLQVLGK